MNNIVLQKFKTQEHERWANDERIKLAKKELKERIKPKVVNDKLSQMVAIRRDNEIQKMYKALSKIEFGSKRFKITKEGIVKIEYSVDVELIINDLRRVINKYIAEKYPLLLSDRYKYFDIPKDR
jgi:hypothetical protein